MPNHTRWSSSVLERSEEQASLQYAKLCMDPFLGPLCGIPDRTGGYKSAVSRCVLRVPFSTIANTTPAAGQNAFVQFASIGPNGAAKAIVAATVTAGVPLTVLSTADAAYGFFGSVADATAPGGTAYNALGVRTVSMGARIVNHTPLLNRCGTLRVDLIGFMDATTGRCNAPLLTSMSYNYLAGSPTTASFDLADEKLPDEMFVWRAMAVGNLEYNSVSEGSYNVSGPRLCFTVNSSVSQELEIEVCTVYEWIPFRTLQSYIPTFTWSGSTELAETIMDSAALSHLKGGGKPINSGSGAALVQEMNKIEPKGVSLQSARPGLASYAQTEEDVNAASSAATGVPLDGVIHHPLLHAGLLDNLGSLISAAVTSASDYFGLPPALANAIDDVADDMLGRDPELTPHRALGKGRAQPARPNVARKGAADRLRGKSEAAPEVKKAAKKLAAPAVAAIKGEKKKPKRK